MTFSGARTARLTGLLDPAGLGVGFMLPVFSAPRENARLVQRIGPDGRIARFDVAEDQDSPLLPCDGRELGLGDEALWGFSLGEETIVLEEQALRSRLATMIEDEALRSRPMLGFEVATFLGRQDIENRYADAAMRRLSSFTPEGARDWRDLSVLTPMLRRSLRSVLGIKGTAWLDELYVSLERDVAIVHGMDGGTSREVSMLRKALKDAADRLPGLFKRPRDGWVVRIAHVEADGDDAERPTPELWITVLGARLTHLLDRAVSGKALDVGVKTLGTSRVTSPPPTAIVFEARDQDAEREARDASLKSRAMMIAVGTPRRGVADPGPTMLREYPHGRIDLPSVGAYQSGALQTTDAVAVRLAAAVAAEIAQGLYEAPHPRSVLIRVADRSEDSLALASLYGRVWALGLSPWKAVHVLGRGEDLKEGYGEDSVRRVLFGGVKIVGGALAARAIVGSRASGGLLVSSSAAEDDDLPRHAWNAATLLRDRGWHVEELHEHEEPRLRVRGGRQSFVMRVPLERHAREQDDPSHDAPLIPRAGYEGLEMLRLVPISSGSTMLACLRADEFPIEMRDLVQLDPSEATIWSVVALQMRRLNSPLPSRVKTLVLATVVRAALPMSDIHDAYGAAFIQEAIDLEHVGEVLQLVLTRSRWADGTLNGTLSVVQKVHGSHRMEVETLQTYEIFVGADGPRLMLPHLPAA